MLTEPADIIADRRQTRVDAERGVGEVGETGGRVDELLGFAASV